MSLDRSTLPQRNTVMDAAIFKAIQPLLDQFAEVAEKHLESAELHHLLSNLGKGKIASLSLTVEVHDSDRNRTLPLLTTGLSAMADKDPYRIWGDSTPQRYVVNEGIQVVPHDRCPVCWELWDFKLQNSSCPNCGTTPSNGMKKMMRSGTIFWLSPDRTTSWHALDIP
jgi:hypothetical protein